MHEVFLKEGGENVEGSSTTTAANGGMVMTLRVFLCSLS
jgi:hypothetical protein